MTMKAIVCTKYGPPEVLQLKEVNKPSPKSNEVLIKIHATAVTISDVNICGSRQPFYERIPLRLMLGLTRPRNPILGNLVAGEIESVGKDVKQFRQGDQVYGFSGFKFGAYAEYVCMYVCK